MPRKNRLTPDDKAILDYLYQQGCPCSVQEIAGATNMNWVTTNAHLKKLNAKGMEYVLKIERPKKSMWQFNFEKHG